MRRVAPLDVMQLHVVHLASHGTLHQADVPVPPRGDRTLPIATAHLNLPPPTADFHAVTPLAFAVWRHFGDLLAREYTHFLIPTACGPAHHLAPQDDAQDARWFDVFSLPPLAFDHKLVVRTSLRHLAAQKAAAEVGEWARGGGYGSMARGGMGRVASLPLKHVAVAHKFDAAVPARMQGMADTPAVVLLVRLDIM